MVGYIYQLSNPGDNTPIYVGSTSDDLKSRLSGHIGFSKISNSPLHSHISNSGIKPTISLLEKVDCQDVYMLREAERRWILKFKKVGIKLYNKTLPSGKSNNELISLRFRDNDTLMPYLIALANEKGISLNQYAVEVLSDHVKKIKKNNKK